MKQRGGKKRVRKNRTVIIATPVKNLYDGISPFYADSLIQTVKMGMISGIDIYPLYQDDAMLQRARNYLMSLAVNNTVPIDDIVWIDSDIGWKYEDFFKLLSYSVDIVGGTFRKRSLKEEYPIQAIDDKLLVDDTGLMKVAGLATGFLRFSRNAFMTLWENSKPYRDGNGKNDSRWCFELTDENGEFVGEDIYSCHKLAKLGFDIFLDPNITCTHVGPVAFEGDFINWLRIHGEPIHNQKGD